MRDENLSRLGRIFNDPARRELLKNNLKYAVISVTISLIAAWLLGANVWVVLIALSLQTVYFFSQKTVSGMTKFLVVNLVIVLVCGLAYNVLIKQTGLVDEWKSRIKSMITRVAVDLDNPGVDIEAGMQRLIRKEADTLYQQNKDDFKGLLKSAERVKRMRDSMYNSMHDKKFHSCSAQQNSAQQI